MKKSLIMTTATVAGLGVVATTPTVFATEAPTGNTVNSTINNKVIDKDLSDAEKRAVDTAKDADQKAKDADQAKDTLDKAQKDKEAKKAEKEALEKDLEKAKDATPEKIQKETEDVDAKEKAKADKDTDAKDKADQVTKKSDAAKRAKEELEITRTGVENAEKELKDATDDFDPAAKEKAQQEKDEADKDVLIKDKAKRDAETELEKAKEDDKTREAKKGQERKNKADKEADKTAKEGLIKDADKAIKDAEEKLKTAQYPTDVVLTPEWREKAKELIKRRMDKYPEPYPDLTGMDEDQMDKAVKEWNARYNVWFKEYRNDMSRLQQELSQLDEGARNQWKAIIRNITENGIQDDDSTIKYDPNNLPQSIVDELNDRFISLLNSLRKQLDLPEAKLNTNDKEFAKEVAKVYKENEYQDDGHFGRGINDVARKRGLKTSAQPGVETTNQYYENKMETPILSNLMTRRQLVEEITITFMYFFAEGDLTGGYGHFYSLLTADHLGVNVSLIKNKNFNLLYNFHIHVLLVSGSNYIDNDDTNIQKSKYDELYGPKSTANLPTPTLQNKKEVEAELEKAKVDKKTAEDHLEQVKTELQVIEKRIADLENEVSETPAKEAKRTEAIKELEKAKEKAEDAQRKLERATLDDKAKSLRLEKAREAKDEADKELAKKLAESQQKDKDLENAKIERLKADKELKDAEDALQKAKDKLADTLRLSQEKAKLEAELKAKSKELDELCKHVDDLKRDVKQKEDEAEKARKVKDEAEREYQKLLLRKTIDDALIPEQPEFKGGVNGPGAIQPELPEFPLDKLPKVDEPKVDEPTVEQPIVEQPKVDEPKVEQPKVEQPKVEQPKVEQPKVEQPKVDEPKVEQPKVEEPNQEPKGDRLSDEPNADKPGQAGDQNVKPVGPAPSYQAPAVLSPAQEEVGQKALPNTGSQVSLLALLGYAFLAGLGIVLKKKEG